MNDSPNPKIILDQATQFLLALASNGDEDAAFRKQALTASQNLDRVQGVLRKRALKEMRSQITKEANES